MRDRAFGVEIECGYNGGSLDEPYCICEYDAETGSYTPPGDEHCVACCGCWADEEEGCSVARQILTAAGFEHWTGSIHGDGSGVEIPSPVLRGVEGLRELRCVMQLLRDNGFRTDERDGLHVHHDAPEFVDDPDLVARLAELWIENQGVIDCFVAPERRSVAEYGSGHWACHPLNVRQVTTFKQTKELDSLGGRFRALNLRALDEHGTIEFRQHEGTLDFEKASAWIHFGQGLLDRAVRRKRVITCATPLDLLRATRTSPKSTRTLMAAVA